MCSYSEIESLIFHVTCNLQMNQPDFWKPLARRGTLFSSFYWSISLRRSNISHLPSYRIFQAISGDKNLLINLQVTLLRMLAAVVLRCLSSHSSIHRVYSAAPRYLRWTSSGRDNTQTRKYTRTHTRTGPFCERCTFVLTVTSSEGQTRLDRGDSLRTTSQARRLNFCALLWRIDIYTLLEGVAWCHRHRVDFPYSFLASSQPTRTRKKKLHLKLAES